MYPIFTKIHSKKNALGFCSMSFRVLLLALLLFISPSQASVTYPIRNVPEIIYLYKYGGASVYNQHDLFFSKPISTIDTFPTHPNVSFSILHEVTIDTGEPFCFYSNSTPYIWLITSKHQQCLLDAMYESDILRTNRFDATFWSHLHQCCVMMSTPFSPLVSYEIVTWVFDSWVECFACMYVYMLDIIQSWCDFVYFSNYYSTVAMFLFISLLVFFSFFRSI